MHKDKFASKIIIKLSSNRDVSDLIKIVSISVNSGVVFFKITVDLLLKWPDVIDFIKKSGGKVFLDVRIDGDDFLVRRMIDIARRKGIDMITVSSCANARPERINDNIRIIFSPVRMPHASGFITVLRMDGVDGFLCCNSETVNSVVGRIPSEVPIIKIFDNIIPKWVITNCHEDRCRDCSYRDDCYGSVDLSVAMQNGADYVIIGDRLAESRGEKLVDVIRLTSQEIQNAVISKNQNMH